MENGGAAAVIRLHYTAVVAEQFPAYLFQYQIACGEMSKRYECQSVKKNEWSYVLTRNPLGWGKNSEAKMAKKMPTPRIERGILS